MNDSPKATHKAAFKVEIGYNFLNEAPNRALLTDELRAAIQHEMDNHGLDCANQYHACALEVSPFGEVVKLVYPKEKSPDPVSSLAEVALVTTAPGYSSDEVDVILCVFDALICFLLESNNELHTDIARYVKGLQEEGGTPHLRSEAARVGCVIESVWLELNNLGLLVNWGEPFDFEFVPQLLAAVHTAHAEFPSTDSRGAWFNAALEVIGVDPHAVACARASKLGLHPELIFHLKEAHGHFKIALDAIGASDLSALMHTDARRVLSELHNLHSLFDD